MKPWGRGWELLTPAGVRRLVPGRPEGAHKGDFGHVLIVAGSRGKTGAARLAGIGALRSGAGLVTVATPESCLPTVAAGAPGIHDAPARRDGRRARERGGAGGRPRCALRRDRGRAGAGNRGRHDPARARPARARTGTAGAGRRCAQRLRRRALSDRPSRGGADVILTPHPGEMARLCGRSAADVQADRLGTARRFATARRAHVVLKGARTLVAAPDGAVHVNRTGNPGMATGGTGDVLAGVVAAWLGQLGDASAACRAGVYLHGLAGDLAAGSSGEAALTASDLAAALGGRSRRRSIRSHGEAETARIARELAAGLAPGSIVLLFGELGVGKTAFVRGLLEGAGGTPEDVSSPTFTLIQQYAARLPVAHVDLYRLAPAEVDDLGLDELASACGIVAIEWADRLPRQPGGAIRVHIDDAGGDRREIRVEHPDAAPARLAPQG